MRRRHKSALSGIMILAIAAAVVLTAVAPALAVPPTWEPDPNSLGQVILYDAAGNVLTGGSNLSHLADYAAVTTAGSVGATTANLIFAAPDSTKVTGLWATGSGSSSTTYPNAGAPAPITGPGFANPVVTLGPTDANLSAFLGSIVKDTTPGYANIYQLRVKDSGPEGAGSGSQYWSADVLVDEGAGTWTLVYPELATTTTTISTTPPNGGNTTTGNNVTMTATVTPASAANGTVQFFDGATPVGSPQAVTTAANTTGVVTHTSPPDGVHNYTAKFTPNGGTLVDDSTSSVSSVSVGPPATPTTTALGVVPTSASQGDPVTMTATVTSPAPPPDGTMEFFTGTTSLGTDTTESAPDSGIYEIVVTTLTPGTHSITATFTPTGNFLPSTSPAVEVTITAAASCSLPGSVCSDDQNIQVTVNAGTITISTPYTEANPFVLPDMQLNPDGTLLSTSAQFPASGDQPIRVTSTLAGNPGWTASVSGTDLNTSPVNATPIDAQGLGLTGLSLVVGPPGKAAPAFTDNPADDPSIASDDANTGLDAPAHTFAQKASDGNGTWDMTGLLTLYAPSTTLAGTYAGIITFTVL